jgi:hypothetical protein
VVALVAELIPIVNEVVAEFTNNRNALIILAGADIGLHFFVNHYKPDASEVANGATGPKRSSAAHTAPSTSETLEQFKQQPAWGCGYFPEKCKALR